ncbi:hypothetical protein BDQ17DRAFT_181194 [Cyathus striatus]|nr:hypothetical protein BDQ17DRAFT_181194 [Cyathus striatus]
MATLIHSFPQPAAAPPLPPVPPPPPHPAHHPPQPQPHLLAALASQHHASEYNRLKFGPKGCPVLYQPLSLAQPDYFSSLRLIQLSSPAQAQPWWPVRPLLPSPPPIPVYGPTGTPAPDPVLLHQISAAIDEPLFAPPSAHLPPSHALKTSASHPINISSIIPLDLLPFLASHALLRDNADSPFVPTVLDIPPSLTLDRLALPRIRTPRHTIPLPSHLPPLPATPHVATRATVTEALHAAINTAIATSPTDLPQIPSPPLIGKRKRPLISDTTITVSLSSPLSHRLDKQPFPKPSLASPDLPPKAYVPHPASCCRAFLDPSPS